MMMFFELFFTQKNFWVLKWDSNPQPSECCGFESRLGTQEFFWVKYSSKNIIITIIFIIIFWWSYKVPLNVWKWYYTSSLLLLFLIIIIINYRLRGEFFSMLCNMRSKLIPTDHIYIYKYRNYLSFDTFLNPTCT